MAFSNGVENIECYDELLQYVPADGFITFCYNVVEIWRSEQLAIDEFQLAVIGSEGAESERYLNILSDIACGCRICWDGLSWQVYEVRVGTRSW